MRRKMIEVFECEICGKVFVLEDEEACRKHEAYHARKQRWEDINRLWKEGVTLGEINDTYSFISKLSDNMRQCTKDSTIKYCYDGSSSFISGNIVFWGYDYSNVVSEDGSNIRKGRINMRRFKNVKLIQN